MSKILNFGDMIDGLYNYYKTTIKPRKDKNRKYKYTGPNTTSNCILVTSPSVAEQLAEDNIKFQKEYRGEDYIKTLLNCAIQLGIQQGINMCSENPERYLENEEAVTVLRKHRLLDNVENPDINKLKDLAKKLRENKG